jgi:hypothetical protein
MNSTSVAKLEATAWLACVACHCLHSTSKGDTVPSPCSAEVWANACTALAHDVKDEKSGSARASVREAFANVSKELAGAGGQGGNKGKGGSSRGRTEVVWETVLEYFQTVRLALTDMRDVAMEWSVRAACDPSSDPAALLRMALDAKVAPKADAVLVSAAALHKWMPLDEISDSAVHAALSARQLSTPRTGGGGGSSSSSSSAGTEAETVLKDILQYSSPAQRLKVAKELIDSGKAAPSLVREVLASVGADACQDNTVKQEARRLMCVPLLLCLSTDSS